VVRNNMAKNEEYQIQKALVLYIKFQYPDVLFNADVGGTWTKNFGTAIKNKLSGHSNGFPDLFFPEPRGKWHGLFIELKTEKGVLSKEQFEWLVELRVRDYRAECCKGFERAKEVIDDYFKKYEENKD